MREVVPTLVTQRTDLGMLTVRLDPEAEGVADRLAEAGISFPEARALTRHEGFDLAWMSPDELLVLADIDALAELEVQLADALVGLHALVVNVSDALAVFSIEGAGAREVLAKLCPVDLSPTVFGAGEMRRTRLAQVAAAFWCTDGSNFTLICFQSVADYVHKALKTAARPTEPVGAWPRG